MATLVEEKVVGIAEIGAEEVGVTQTTAEEYEEIYVPPYTPPVEITAPEIKEKIPPATFYTQHQLFLESLRRGCLSVEELAKATGMSIEEIELHRSILELDEAGVTVHKGHKVICLTDALENLVTKLRRFQT